MDHVSRLKISTQQLTWMNAVTFFFSNIREGGDQGSDGRSSAKEEGRYMTILGTPKKCTPTFNLHRPL
jgi:hypothetical protein